MRHCYIWVSKCWHSCDTPSTTNVFVIHSTEVDTISSAKRRAMDAKKRAGVPVVGDMNPLNEALPELSEILRIGPHYTPNSSNTRCGFTVYDYKNCSANYIPNIIPNSLKQTLNLKPNLTWSSTASLTLYLWWNKSLSNCCQSICESTKYYQGTSEISGVAFDHLNGVSK